MTNRCSDCRYFDNTVEKPLTSGTYRRVSELPTGLCRINPPTIAASPDNAARWPFCRATDWCGRFAQREE